MRTRSTTASLLALGSLAAATLVAGGCLLACHSGSPSAPDGTKILLECDFIEATRDFVTGNFDARITARVIDSASNVPQTGVGVFFHVESGPGEFLIPSPIRTTNAGFAQNTLRGTGATRGNTISVNVFSGEAAEADIEIDVADCDVTTSTNEPPRAVFTVTPNRVLPNTDVTVNVASSTDLECPGGDPTSWSVDWDDGSAVEEDIPFATTTKTHRYPQLGTFDIKVIVEDCEGETGDDTHSVTVTNTP